MRIEFDPAKNERNIRDRGLSFDRAGEMDFAAAVTVEDTRRAYPERRFRVLGCLAEDRRLYSVVITPIPGGIRVISFRKASKTEVRQYEKAKASKP